VQPSPVDPAVPSPARVWNYWLGGTDNFPADRELAERVMVAMPSMPLIASGVPTAPRGPGPRSPASSTAST